MVGLFFPLGKWIWCLERSGSHVASWRVTWIPGRHLRLPHLTCLSPSQSHLFFIKGSPPHLVVEARSWQQVDGCFEGSEAYVIWWCRVYKSIHQHLTVANIDNLRTPWTYCSDPHWCLGWGLCARRDLKLQFNGLMTGPPLPCTYPGSSLFGSPPSISKSAFPISKMPLRCTRSSL